VILQLLAAAQMLLASAVAIGPPDDAFYQPPSPLPHAKHGDVIWARPLVVGAALPHAAANWLVLYHSVSPRGEDTAVSGTVAIPQGTPPPGGWRVISWAHGTTGNGPQCTPSTYRRLDGEQRLMDSFVSQGYAVVQTDYEGQSTPGIHPYFVGESYSHDLADAVRAARQIDSSIGPNWVVMGHSEGGDAALWAAAGSPGWTPELQLRGAVAYAPGSNIEGFFQQMLQQNEPSGSFPLFALMLQSFGTYEPGVHLGEILTPEMQQLLPDLQKMCDGELRAKPAWSSIVPSHIFKRNAPLQPLIDAFVRNDPSNLQIRVPVLLIQGSSDTIVPQDLTSDLRAALCSNGATLWYDVFRATNHATVLPTSFAQALPWVGDRFAAVRARTNCRTAPQVY